MEQKTCRRRTRVAETVEKLPDKMRTAPEGSAFTRRQWTVIFLFLFINFCAGLAYSIQSPFFPAEAEKKGTPPSVYGFIFGIFQLVSFITCPIYGKYIGRLGAKFIFCTGILLTSFGLAGFGLVSLLPGGTIFIVTTFAVRIVEALGASAYLTAGFVVISFEFPNNVATVFSNVQTALGFGLIVGPTIGGILYQMGGFPLPFFTQSIVLVFAFFLAVFILPTQGIPSKTQQRGLKAYTSPGIFIGCYTLFVTSISSGFMSTTLEPHLRQFKLTPIATGGAFMVSGGCFAATAPLWGRLADKHIHPKLVSGFSSAFISLAYLFIGPIPLIPLNPSLYLVLLSLVFSGIGGGGQNTSVFLDASREAIRQGFPDDIHTHGQISGLCFSTMALGGFIGPSAAGIIVDSIGYRKGTVIIFLLQLSVATLCFAYYILRKKSSSEEKISTEDGEPLLEAETLDEEKQTVKNSYLQDNLRIMEDKIRQTNKIM